MRADERPGPTELARRRARPHPAPVPRIPERAMSVKSLLLTAGIALVVVVAYEKSKGKLPAVKFGA